MSPITDAWLRGGAGPMKDRRAPRGGGRQAARREIDEALADFSQARAADAVTEGMAHSTTEPEPEFCACGRDTLTHGQRLCGDCQEDRAS